MVKSVRVEKVLFTETVLSRIEIINEKLALLKELRSTPVQKGGPILCESITPYADTHSGKVKNDLEVSNVEEVLVGEIKSLFWETFDILLSSNMCLLSPDHQTQSYVFREIGQILSQNSSFGNVGKYLINPTDCQLQIEILIDRVLTPEVLFSKSPAIYKAMIQDDLPSAREYLKGCDLCPADFALISGFSKHKLECIMVHVIGIMFTNMQFEFPIVKISALIHKLDATVREQAREVNKVTNVKSKKEDSFISTNEASDADNTKDPFVSLDDTHSVESTGSKTKEARFPIGKHLVEFLLERGIIHTLTSEVVKNLVPTYKNHQYMTPLFAICSFKLADLPLKLHLPMVSLPIEWGSPNVSPETLNEVTGGYYINHGNAGNRSHFRLLTSRDYSKFNVKLCDSKRLFKVMNSLQGQAFQVNKRLLSFIKENETSLISQGLLKPRYLSSISLMDGYNAVQDLYNRIDGMIMVASCGKLITEYFKDVQQARYENLILTIAEVYKDLPIYLPVFIDFRGRMYRPGVFHFHERDLSKSLVVFKSKFDPIETPKFMAYKKELNNLSQRISYFRGKVFLSERSKAKFKKLDARFDTMVDNVERHLNDFEKEIFTKAKIEDYNSIFFHEHYSSLLYHSECAAAFKYKKCYSLYEAHTIYHREIKPVSKDADSLIEMATHSSDPFQFLAKVLYNEGEEYKTDTFMTPPMSQDASASAYQIMSYLLLNHEIGVHTNLLPSNSTQIEDIYSFLRKDLLAFINRDLFNSSTFSFIQESLTRKLVKGIFMPLIYGKTMTTVCSDLYASLGPRISHQDAYLLSKEIFLFWNRKYPEIVNLMRLLNLIGWFSSILDRPVVYSTPFLRTFQDYRLLEKEELIVYDRLHRRKHRVSLQFQTNKRDTRKTLISTCVNLIHQLDSFIAMRVVEEFSKQNPFAPLYIVHDNFISTPYYHRVIPQIYMKVFKQMASPLTIINTYICENLNYEESVNIGLIHEPIPTNILGSIFKNLEKNVEKKDLKKWTQKKAEVFKCYESYVKTVCGDGTSQSLLLRHHYSKLNAFNSSLKKWEEAPLINCLQY